jgi:hypothetical protein
MAETKYTYSISGDITGQEVDPACLQKEIVDSAIATAVNYINTSGDVLDIFMADALSAGDETILDGIVQNHLIPGTVVTGTTRDLMNCDYGKTLFCTNAAGCALSINADELRPDFECHVVQMSASQVSFGGTATLVAASKYAATKKTDKQYSEVEVKHSSTANTFVLSGDLELAP